MFVEATAPYYHKGPWRVSDLDKKLGGTKRVAEALGVSQRQVERYINYERGHTQKQYRSTKNVQGRINAIGKQFEKPPSSRGREGVSLDIGGRIRVRSGKKGDDIRDRDIEWELSDDEWEHLVRVAQEQGEEAAQHYFFDEIYGVIGMSLMDGGQVDAV